MHQAPIAPLTDRYLEDEYFDDLIKVTKGKTDEVLARKAIRESEGCLAWMIEQGIRFQPSLSGTLSLSRTNAFFLGGGKALVNALYRRAEALGVDIRYRSEVTHLVVRDDQIEEIVFQERSGPTKPETQTRSSTGSAPRLSLPLQVGFRPIPTGSSAWGRVRRTS